MAKKKQAAALVAEARRQAEQGNIFGARDLARKATDLERKNPDAWYVLGGTFGAEGNAAECIRYCEKVLKLDPRHEGALFNLALSQHTLGRYDQTIAALRKLLRIAPGHHPARILMADSLDAAGAQAQATDLRLQILQSDPESSNLYQRLAALESSHPRFNQVREVLTERARRDQAPALLLAAVSTLALKANATFEATDWANRAVDLDPNLAAAHAALGTAYLREMHHALAVGAFRKAAELAPDVVDYQCGLARALAFSGESEEGGALIEKAQKQHPDRPIVVRTMGQILARTGRHDAALEHYRGVPDKDPMLYFEMAQAARYREGAPEIAEMEAALEAAAGSLPRDRAALCFALGKVYNDIGDYDRAFERYREGNALVRRTIEFNAARTRDFFARIAHDSDAGALAADPAFASASDRPVFIIGMPRSGTTLLESVLSAHSRIRSGGELPLMALLVRYLEHASSLPYPKWLAPGAVAAEPQRDAVAALVEDYDKLARGADRVTDKMPDNFRHVAVIRRLLPNARIIHIQRHPADTCLSIYFQLFAPEKHRYAWELSELGEYYLQYLRLMAHWRELIGENLIEVRYEDLITHRDRETRRLITACGLEWDDGRLDFRRSQEVVHTASQWQVRQDVYTTSMLRYKRYEAHLGPLLDALGDCVGDYEAGLTRTDAPIAAGA